MAEDGWKLFIELCNELKNKEQFAGFLDFFLTLEEKEDIAKRVLIIKELLLGSVTQRELASKLGVSISKITRGSHALKRYDPEVKRLIQEFLTNE